MIKGKLTGLRAIEQEDLNQLKDWRNLPQFRRNFREVRELGSQSQLAWFNSLQTNSNRDFMFSIVELESGKLIGACGLLYINWIIRSADFSFYIGKDELYIDDEGMALDAATILINYGFENLNLHKIWMELYEFDEKKIKFFQQNFNFKTDGVLRDNCYEDGRYYNSLIISLLATDK
ncbi:GNAT family N-acetyltransferase [Panacibacter sp. DH6]|uniref:GNAT family N-acetyltransferase n=1 Tax=Panacibacter microcysteis TaxID=2793269 RepID=A0A931E5X2_9BACT|nr:GNAT family protein [Panacibacter microcysteis]MBG9375739.1 GNAT family N-acetyltransferase [Panacibacter microcysteis]